MSFRLITTYYDLNANSHSGTDVNNEEHPFLLRLSKGLNDLLSPPRGRKGVIRMNAFV